MELNEQELSELNELEEAVSMQDVSPVSPGDSVRCMVSGAEGVANIVAFHLGGYIRVGVLPSTPVDGRPQEMFWSDASLLEVVGESESDPATQGE